MADSSLGLVFKEPFQEQLDYFRGKLNLPTERWDDVTGAAHDRAFVVAGAAKADMLQDLRDAVDKAIAQGTGLQAFRKDLARIVQQYGWDYTGSFDWRSRVIYQSNLAASYSAGRWAQLNDPDLVQARPFVQYVHADGVAHPRPLHLSWNDITLRRDDPWVATHATPNGWGCHCRWRAVSQRTADALPADRRVAPNDGTETVIDSQGQAHEVPAGVDYGWGHMPGAASETSFSQLIADKLIRWDARIGSAAFDAMRDALTPALTQEFSGWADALTQPSGQMRIVGALSERVVGQLAAQGIAPQSAHLAVRDVDVLHTHRDSKADTLPWSWYRELPAHLAEPAAVLLDRTKPDAPALLYVFDIEGVGNSTAKLVARLDYAVATRDAAGKKARVPFNVLVTGRGMDAQALRDPVSYEVLEGSLD